MDCIVNKVNEIEPFLNLNKIDIAAFTETNPKNCSNEYLCVNTNLKGYNCLSNYDGRGVCLYINDSFEVLQRLSDIEAIFKPSIFCRVKSQSSEVFTVGVVYRSPNSSVDENNNLMLQIDRISKRLMKSGEKFVLLGDFNFPEISWVDETCDKPLLHPASNFLNIVQSNYLSQFVNKPTHHRALQTPTLIDLILSNDPEFVFNLEFCPPFGKSHHSVITFFIDVKPIEVTISSRKKFSFNKGNYAAMRNHFKNFDWNILLECDDINDMWNKFECILTNAMNLFIPKYTKKSVYKHKYNTPPTLLSKLQCKREAFKTFKRFPTESNRKIYAKYRNQVRWESRKSKISNEKRIAGECKTNPKLFYQYVNSKLKSKENVSSLMKDDGSLTQDDSEKAEILNDFFSSVFTEEDKSDVPDFITDQKDFISELNISREDIVKKLQSLKPDKSPGPDGLHPRVLKELSEEIADPLEMIFNKSMGTGKLPDKWKLAEVRPIFKKGDKTEPGNYRPVSLTSIVCKLYEGFIRDKLFEHLTVNGLLSEEQYGFCGGRSCTTQLLNTLNDWLYYLDNHIPVDAVYLDFRKAFDTVPHERLLKKLYGYGIRGHILQWIRDFLTNRYQYVSINDNNSCLSEVSSGVPQGSVLGPTLFIYFINDLPDVVSTFLKIFADDTKAYQPINSITDKNKLQDTINKLYEWSEKWLLKFNGSKCKVLHLGKNNPQYEYTIQDGDTIKTLEVTNSEKDLGVYMDPLLNFDIHIANVIKKARRLTGLIVRSITYKSKEIMVPLFKTLVRPHLEYAQAVWSPYKRKYINQIESVQRHFTKYIIGMYDLSYEDRMKSLQLPSLEFRRLRGDLIETYKICHNLYDPITTNTLLKFNVSNTRSHNFKLLKPRVNSTQFLKFYTNRVINVWNNLPQATVNAESVNVFKNCVDKYFKELMYSINILV